MTTEDVEALANRLDETAAHLFALLNELDPKRRRGDRYGVLLLAQGEANQAAQALRELAEQNRKYLKAIESALGCLDDPRGGAQIEDMRRANRILSASLQEEPNGND